MKRHRKLAGLAGTIFAAGAIACGLTLPASGAGHEADESRFNIAVFADEPAREQIVVVSGADGRRTGVEGMNREARLLEGDEIEAALSTIRARGREDGVSMVSIDSEGRGGVEILADDDGGDSAYIRIGEGGIVIHAGDGEDSFHMKLGDDHHIDDDDGVRIHARGGDDDADDRAVVVMKGLDEDATRDFIGDLDDVPRSIREQMKRALGL